VRAQPGIDVIGLLATLKPTHLTCDGSSNSLILKYDTYHRALDVYNRLCQNLRKDDGGCLTSMIPPDGYPLFVLDQGALLKQPSPDSHFGIGDPPQHSFLPGDMDPGICAKCGGERKDHE
jgi:hypothetical protein